MATNTSAQLSADISRYLDHKVLPVAQRQLVVFQFSQKIKLPKGRGTTWTATRFNRVPLPYAPISEGTPPPGQQFSITQATGTALQWGDRIIWTDVSEITIEHPLMERATFLLGLQMGETLERNLFQQLTGCTQVNYVNQRGARAMVQAGDLLDTATVGRTVANLKNLGARMMNGPQDTDVKKSIEADAKAARANPASHEHYVSVGSSLVLEDFANNPTVTTAWSFSDINRLYINEYGQWRGMHFCWSNLIPSFVGVANTGINPTPGTAGNLAGTTYYVLLTGSDVQNQYESRIYAVSAGQLVTGPNGSIAITTPSTAGFTYSAYIGLNTSPQNLATSASGPTSGPLAGQATQLPPGTTVTLTGVGVSQVPPASPAVGVIVFPTFVFGEESFATIELENVTWMRLTEADKSDPMNQLRMLGWKAMLGTVILNNQYLARIELSCSNSGNFG